MPDNDPMALPDFTAFDNALKQLTTNLLRIDTAPLSLALAKVTTQFNTLAEQAERLLRTTQVPENAAVAQAQGEVNRVTRDRVRTEREVEKEKVRNEKDHAQSQGELSQGLQRGTRSLFQFSSSILHVNTSLTGFLMQAAGAGGGMLTNQLAKSMQLVFLEVGKLLIPSMVGLSAEVQNFAKRIEYHTKNLDNPFLGLGVAIGELIGKINAAAIELAVKIPGVKQAVSSVMPGSAPSAERAVRAGQMTDIAVDQVIVRQMEAQFVKIREQQRQYWRKMSEAERALWAEKGIKSEEEFLKMAREGDGAFSNMIAQMRKDPRWAAVRKGIMPPPLAAGAGGAAGGAAPGGEQGGTGGPPSVTDQFKHGIAPPGYQARFIDLGQVRREMQIAALNQTPLDALIRQKELEFYNAVMAHIQKRNSEMAAPKFPAR